MKQHPASLQGFTLLELLVSLTICVFIGIGAHAMLQSVIHAQNVSKERSAKLTQLQKAMWVITQDMEQMISQTMQLSSGSYSIIFIRKGWSNPMGLPRSNQMQVAYEIDGNKLKRLYWSAEEKGAAPQTQLLIEDVTSFSLQQISSLALEINFSTTLYGSLRRVIEIPEMK